MMPVQKPAAARPLANRIVHRAKRLLRLVAAMTDSYYVTPGIEASAGLARLGPVPNPLKRRFQGVIRLWVSLTGLPASCQA